MMASSVVRGLAAVLSAVVLSGCRAKPVAAPTETPPVLVGPENLFVVENREVQSGPQVSGTLTAERSATVRAELSGTILSAPVEEGQSVVRGQVLGRISDEAVGDAVLSAKSGARTAEEALMVAKRNAERAEKLSQAGALSDRDLEQARWSVTNAEAGVADAQARLAAAEKQQGHTVLRAPFSGIVSERHINAGDNVSPGGPTFSIVDPSSLRLEAQVPVSALGTLKLGTPVPFAVDGVGERSFQGRIVRINPSVDPGTGQVRITVALPNKAGRLVAGLFAQGRIAASAKNGIVVPNAAIDRRGLRPTVTRIQRGQVERVEVALGVEDPAIDRVEITAGLAVGDTVVTGSPRSMQPGTKVRPSAPAERAKTSGN